MKTRYFDHIDLRVKELKEARRFYGQVLPELGFTREAGDEVWWTFYLPGEAKREFFGFTEDPEHRPNGNRISFWADTAEEVDRIAEVVRKAGGRVLDGNKLEICWRTPVA